MSSLWQFLHGSALKKKTYSLIFTHRFLNALVTRGYKMGCCFWGSLTWKNFSPSYVLRHRSLWLLPSQGHQLRCCLGVQTGCTRLNLSASSVNLEIVPDISQTKKEKKRTFLISGKKHCTTKHLCLCSENATELHPRVQIQELVVPQRNAVKASRISTLACGFKMI